MGEVIVLYVMVVEVLPSAIGKPNGGLSGSHAADLLAVLGHALGSTDATPVTKAVHELRRFGGELALVTMCCDGGIGTGPLFERV